jgi:hypothetical protein
MGLMGNWTDKVDGVDDVLAEDINSIARAVISIEEANGDIDAALDRIIAIQNELMGNTATITFTINGTEYTATEDMPWGEWVESEHNTVNAYINAEQENRVYIGINYLRINTWDDVYDTDAIIADAEYTY